MPSSAASILIVEDVPTLAKTYLAFLAGEPVEASAVASGAEALSRIEQRVPDVLIVDVNLPDTNGLDILREVKRRALPTEVVVITANGSVNLAVEAMRLGAFDFVVKPVSPERLRITVRNVAERRRLSSALDAVRDEIGREGFCGFIGRSLAMQTVYHIIQSAARSTATIFVTGESGTGKELCAEAVHRMSRRSQGPFVPINCAAIPQDLLESELFGHVKGAYTGATSDRQGAAMRAHGGTLFLDEIGEMRPEFQAKMLRFLQTGTVQRVGEDKVHAVDVRIVCATNRDPQAEVAAGRFREDLYYRLHVVPIELPPLRERDDDALLLARHFLKRYADEDGANVTGFTSDAEEALLRYRWPGNIRELQNVVRHVVVLSKGGAAGLDSLPGPVRSAMDAQRPAHSRVRGGEPQLDASEASAAIQPLEETIEQAIERAIRLSEGSIPRAAAALKVSPSTIYRRLQSRATA